MPHRRFPAPTPSRPGAVLVPPFAYLETRLDSLCRRAHDEGLAPVVDAAGQVVESVRWPAAPSEVGL